MNKFYGLVGVAAMILLPARMIWLHGRTWEFGPHGLPVSILSPDGTRYRDGSEIDLVSAALIRNGMEKTYWMAWVSLMACVAYELSRQKHVTDIRARRQQSNVLLALAQRYEREGRLQEAERAFESHRQSVEAEMALWLKRRSTRRLLETARKTMSKRNSEGAAQAGRD